MKPLEIFVLGLISAFLASLGIWVVGFEMSSLTFEIFIFLILLKWGVSNRG